MEREGKRGKEREREGKRGKEREREQSRPVRVKHDSQMHHGKNRKTFRNFDETGVIYEFC